MMGGFINPGIPGLGMLCGGDVEPPAVPWPEALGFGGCVWRSDNTGGLSLKSVPGKVHVTLSLLTYLRPL